MGVQAMAGNKAVLFLKFLLFLSFFRSYQGISSKNNPKLEKASKFSIGAPKKYDYIVVGGGTAGCPLAATLSQNYSVLLLERGGSPYGNLNVSYMQNFHISLTDTSPDSPSQAFISTDGVINARARILGGGTCINAGFYSRASTRWVKEAGLNGELVDESYPWIEKRIVNLPELAPWQAALRDGLLDAGVSPFNGYTYDHIIGTKVGGTTFDKDGYRRTAADLLAAGNSDNLRVLLHATVQRIIFDRSRRRHPRAVGVEFKDENGVRHVAALRRRWRSEVVVSAGAIGSPQLLILSGIGPHAELRRLRIPAVSINKHVGQEMADNPSNSIFIPTRGPVEQSLIQTVGITKLGSFIEGSSGFGQSQDSIHWHHGIMSAEIGQISTIPPKLRTLEMAKSYATKKHGLPKEAFRGGFILEKIDGPLSRGNLTLVDADAGTSPNVTFNYFSHPEDLRRCVDGIRTIERVVRTRHFDVDSVSMNTLLNISVAANVNLIPKHTNDTTSLEQFCKDTVTTIWHYHGGCNVGKVVDSDYRVIGVSGLRIVDSSTFTRSPGTNPQATVMMFGRYMGVKILRRRMGRAAGV